MILKRIADPETRKKTLQDMRENFPEEEFASSTFLSYCLSDRTLEGKNLYEISKNSGEAPYEVALNLLEANSCVVSAFFNRQNENDIRTVISDPLSMIGSDIGVTYDQEKTHPRAYGSFPKVIGRYARKAGLFTFQEAIRKMTSAPAQRAGFNDRGLIKVGMWADIVVFDRNIIIDRATYDDPTLTPLGIDYVLVNGVVSVEKGRHTGKLSGMILKHQPRKV